MRFISILASASVKLATRIPGATRVVCPSAPEMAPALDLDAPVLNLDAMGDDYFQSINDDYREKTVPAFYESGYATLHEIPIYPSLAEGTSDRWARGEVQAHLDALRP